MLKNSSNQARHASAITLGAGLGLIFGAALDQIALGLVLGAAIGRFFPALFDRIRDARDEED